MKKITVQMTKEFLYDFLLFHAYSKFSGFLINVLGLAVAFMGVILYVTGRTGTVGIVCYLVAAFIFLASTPFQLKMRAKKQVEVNEEYAQPVEYSFSDEGVERSYADQNRFFKWEEIERAVVTPKTIGIYYGKDFAMILPKKNFGDQFVPIFTIIARNLGQSKVRMR